MVSERTSVLVIDAVAVAMLVGVVAGSLALSDTSYGVLLIGVSALAFRFLRTVAERQLPGSHLLALHFRRLGILGVGAGLVVLVLTALTVLAT